MQRMAEDFAAVHPDWECRVPRTAWDAPNVCLSWQSNGLSRNVNQLIRGTEWPLEVEITGAAWADSERGREFLRWLDLPEAQRTLTIASEDDVESLLAPALESAALQVDTIRRAAAAGAAGR
jgi:hypothetical protein